MAAAKIIKIITNIFIGADGRNWEKIQLATCESGGDLESDQI